MNILATSTMRHGSVDSANLFWRKLSLFGRAPTGWICFELQHSVETKIISKIDKSTETGRPGKQQRSIGEQVKVEFLHAIVKLIKINLKNCILYKIILTYTNSKKCAPACKNMCSIEGTFIPIDARNYHQLVLLMIDYHIIVTRAYHRTHWMGKIIYNFRSQFHMIVDTLFRCQPFHTFIIKLCLASACPHHLLQKLIIKKILSFPVLMFMHHIEWSG